MPTPAERNALLFFSLLTLLGGGVRVGASMRRPEPGTADSAALEAQIAAVDSAILVENAEQRARKRKRGSSAGDGTTASSAGGSVAVTRDARSPPVSVSQRLLDMDVASATELERLPWVGPKLAERIVADRDSLGPFGSLGGLERVRGIGPVMAKRLAPHVTFSRTPRPANAVTGGR
ncbi:MAG: ComEA family DNA-binding protein [Gemmatimonadaceae bacterium]